jgi:hypothetical protein
MAVALVYVPSYLAVALLSRCLQEHPALVEGVSGFRPALLRGCLFIMERRLAGRGYEVQAGMIEALDILCLGKVSALLAAEPNFCPELAGLLRQVRGRVAGLLERRDVSGPWGETYADGYRRVLGVLATL